MTYWFWVVIYIKMKKRCSVKPKWGCFFSILCVSEEKTVALTDAILCAFCTILFLFLLPWKIKFKKIRISNICTVQKHTDELILLIKSLKFLLCKWNVTLSFNHNNGLKFMFTEIFVMHCSNLVWGRLHLTTNAKRNTVEIWTIRNKEQYHH